MAGVNKAIILGNLGQNPEITYTQAGLAVCKFSLATSRKMKDGSQVTQWHRCTAFGKAGELINQYTSKGQQLYVDGEIRYSQYERDGVTRYSTDIIVNEFNFVNSGDRQQNTWQGNNQQQGGYQNNPPPSNMPNNNDNSNNLQNNFAGENPSLDGQVPPPEDDIPF